MCKLAAKTCANASANWRVDTAIEPSMSCNWVSSGSVFSNVCIQVITCECKGMGLRYGPHVLGAWVMLLVLVVRKFRGNQGICQSLQHLIGNVSGLGAVLGL